MGDTRVCVCFLFYPARSSASCGTTLAPILQLSEKCPKRNHRYTLILDFLWNSLLFLSQRSNTHRAMLLTTALQKRTIKKTPFSFSRTRAWSILAGKHLLRNLSWITFVKYSQRKKKKITTNFSGDARISVFLVSKKILQFSHGKVLNVSRSISTYLGNAVEFTRTKLGIERFAFLHKEDYDKKKESIYWEALKTEGKKFQMKKSRVVFAPSTRMSTEVPQVNISISTLSAYCIH